MKKTLIFPTDEIAHLDLQIAECAENLAVAKKQTASEKTEKRMRVAELRIANERLLVENIEKGKRAADLIVANKELKFQNRERQKRALELIIANEELKKAQASQQEYIKGLKEMMFMTSHHLRQPIVQILGLAEILTPTASFEELNEIVRLIKKSAESLNDMTKELTTIIHDQTVKARL